MFDRFTKPRSTEEKLFEKDCEECRIIGSGGLAVMGAYVAYHSRAPYYLKHPRAQIGIRILSAGCFYLSLARAIYLPPFSHLKGTMDEFPLNDNKKK